MNYVEKKYCVISIVNLIGVVFLNGERPLIVDFGRRIFCFYELYDASNAPCWNTGIRKKKEILRKQIKQINVYIYRSSTVS